MDASLDTSTARRSPDIGRLFDQHARRLRGAMYTLCGDAEVADDVVQKTFLEAWKRRATLYDSPALKGWLYRKAYHLMQHHWRAQKAYQGVKERVTWVAPRCTPDREHTLTQQERGEQVRAHIAALPAPYRDVFVLSGCAELDGPEIAAVLDIPVNTVYVRMFRGKKLFLERWGAGDDAQRSLRPTADLGSTWAWLATVLPPEIVSQIGCAERLASELGRFAAESGTTLEALLEDIAGMTDQDRLTVLLRRAFQLTDEGVAEIVDAGGHR